MRTCLNCKYRDIRPNVSKCYQCQETNTFINWKSDLLHKILGGAIEVLLLLAMIVSAVCVIASPNRDTRTSCVILAVSGSVGFCICLLALEYIYRIYERRRIE